MKNVKEISFSSPIKGTVLLPGSKSISNRALLIQALSGGVYELENLSKANDTSVLQKLLAMQSSEATDVEGGTVLRFMTAFASIQPGKIFRIDGTPRMRQRPIKILVNALRQLGADIRYLQKEDFPPLEIRGKALKGGKINLNSEISSQFISALMMIGNQFPEGLTLCLTHEIISKPYIQMTMDMINYWGGETRWKDEKTIVVAPKPYATKGHLTIEADWTSASYFYELVALSPDIETEIQLLNLNTESWQGDAETKHLFMELGVETIINEQGITLKKIPYNKNPLHLCLQYNPDLVQTLAATCCMLKKPFYFTGLQSLKIKETNRLEALITELRKCGAIINSTGNDLSFNGTLVSPKLSPTINTYNDHRMAMAFAPCALRINNLKIENPQVVEKSFPNFWKEIEKFEK